MTKKGINISGVIANVLAFLIVILLAIILTNPSNQVLITYSVPIFKVLIVFTIIAFLNALRIDSKHRNELKE